jgi:hypothetical protein
MKTRPYVMYLIARAIRKEARYRFDVHLITEGEYEQVCIKTRLQTTLDAVADFAEEEGLDIYDMAGQVKAYFKAMVEVLDTYDDTAAPPELHFTPGVRGRKARRALGLPYNEKPEFIEDKELYERGPQDDVEVDEASD